MSREAMKALVRAREKCKDVAVGRWLAYYEEGHLDKKRQAMFVEHLGECLHCMALYNIETRHKYGYIDVEQTRARRVKVTLLEWLPPREHIIAALLVCVLVVSAATPQKHISPQETPKESERQLPELSALLHSPPPLREDEHATPESARRQLRQGHDPSAPQGRATQNALRSGGAAIESPSLPPEARPTPVTESPKGTERQAGGEVMCGNQQPEGHDTELASGVAPAVKINGAGTQPPNQEISQGSQSHNNNAGVIDESYEKYFRSREGQREYAGDTHGKAGS